MNGSRSLESRLGSHFAAEAPPRAPDWVLAEALATIDLTPQRRVVLRAPWRIPAMPFPVKLILAAALLLAIAGLGIVAVGGLNRPAPTPTPSATHFSSTLNAYSIDLPAGWDAHPATTTWTSTGPIVSGDDPYLDVFVGSSGYGPIFIASQALTVPGSEWINTQLPWNAFWGSGKAPDNYDLGGTGTCFDPPNMVSIDFKAPAGDAARPVALLDAGCPEIGLRAVVTTTHRGYVFVVKGPAPVDWFRQLLSTVTLRG